MKLWGHFLYDVSQGFLIIALEPSTKNRLFEKKITNLF